MNEDIDDEYDDYKDNDQGKHRSGLIAVCAASAVILGILLVTAATGSGSQKNNNVYGATLKSNTQITSGHYVYTINLYINDDEHFKYVLNNYLKIEEKINSAMKEIQKIYELMNSLQTVVNNISSTFIEEIIDQHKLKQSIRSLEEVTEYLENQRY